MGEHQTNLDFPDEGDDLRALSWSHAPDTSREAIEAHDESGQRQTNRMAILMCVREQPNHTSAEYARLTSLGRHEAASRLCDLRNDGLVRHNGVARECAVCRKNSVEWEVDPRDMLLIDQAWKASYYETAHWKAKRRERMEHDDFLCVLCGVDEELEVHHICYRLFEEELRHLMTVCHDCHQTIHEHAKIRFPRTVDRALIARHGDGPLDQDEDEPPQSA